MVTAKQAIATRSIATRSEVGRKSTAHPETHIQKPQEAKPTSVFRMPNQLQQFFIDTNLLNAPMSVLPNSTRLEARREPSNRAISTPSASTFPPAPLSVPPLALARL